MQKTRIWKRSYITALLLSDADGLPSIKSVAEIGKSGCLLEFGPILQFQIIAKCPNRSLFIIITDNSKVFRSQFIFISNKSYLVSTFKLLK